MKPRNKIIAPRLTNLGAQNLPVNRRRVGAPAIYALDKMLIGDCVKVEGKSFGAVSAAIWRYQAKHQERYRVRYISGHGNKTVTKIWRVL